MKGNGGNNMKRTLIVLAGVFIIVGLGMAFTSNQETAPSITKAPPPAALSEMIAKIDGDAQKCTGDVILDMGNIRLKVPRDITTVTLENGESIKSLAVPASNYSCEQGVIKNVSEYHVGNISIYHKPNQTFKTSYQRAADNFKLHKMSLKRNFRDDGVGHLTVLSANSETFTLPETGVDTEYFLMPIESSPTLNNEEALYACKIRPPNYQGNEKISCNIRYYHPNGLFINATIPRFNNTTDALKMHDARMRTQIENLVIIGK